MLKIKRQQKYLQDRLDELEKHLKKFCKNKSQEDLHALRIALKKYRALVYLSAKIAKQKKLNQFLVPVKEFFRTAGEIRSIYVHHRLLHKHKIKNEDILKPLELELEKKTLEFIEISSKKHQNILKGHKQICKHLPKLESKPTIEFFEKYLKSTEECLMTAVDFHECRKQLKRLLYLKEIFSKKSLEKLGFNFSYIDELQDAIGNWHDALMLKDYLSEIKGVNKRLLHKVNKEVSKTEEIVHNLRADLKNKLRVV